MHHPSLCSTVVLCERLCIHVYVRIHDDDVWRCKGVDDEKSTHTAGRVIVMIYNRGGAHDGWS